MRAQQVYDTVVLPFMDATKRAGISPASAARLVGVSRVTPYCWMKRRFMPHEDMQDVLLDMTKTINDALEKNKLPLTFDYDAALRQVLGLTAEK
jgi:hypothetical protein